ncbi:hypothetical protein MRBBS_2397 [Marinobacter sp. BSs20148]|nr:hypothetical protein MRBBS_2397 [Marinobacter sp. BSs20148]
MLDLSQVDYLFDHFKSVPASGRHRVEKTKPERAPAWSFQSDML